jgi:hypothetical protein
MRNSLIDMIYGCSIDVSMPLNHTFRAGYLLFQIVMVAFTAMMVAFSARDGYEPLTDRTAAAGLFRAAWQSI